MGLAAMGPCRGGRPGGLRQRGRAAGSVSEPQRGAFLTGPGGGEPSALSAESRPGAGGEGGQGKTCWPQGDAAAESSSPAVVRRVTGVGKKWVRVVKGVAEDSIGKTVQHGRSLQLDLYKL